MRASAAAFVAVASMASVNAQSSVPTQTQAGSLIAILSSIPECARMATLFNGTRASTYLNAVYTNLTASRGASPSQSQSQYTLIAFTDAAADAFIKQGGAAGSQAQAMFTSSANQASLLTYHIIPNVVVDFNSNPSALPPFLPTYLSRYGSGFDNLGNGLFQTIGIITPSDGKPGAFTTGTVTGTVQKSIKTDFGIIHVVSSVLAIPTDIVSTCTNYAYTDYLNYVNVGNLSASLRALQGITVLIPEQGGIPRFMSAAGVSDISTALKMAIVEYHVISGIYYSNQLPSLASNSTALQSYFDGQPVYVSDATHWATGKGLNAATIKITKPDILFDSGVIHVVDTVLLPPTVANAQATPSPSPLSQIYPAGQDPNTLPPLASDFPVGSVVGGVLAGVVVISIAVGLYFVIRRRRLITRLEEEKKIRDVEMDEYVRIRDFSSNEKPGLDTPGFIISGQQQQHRHAHADAEDKDEVEESEEESEEEDGSVTKQSGIRAAQDQIMNYRRAQWASDDPRRKSIAFTSSDKQQERVVGTVEGKRPRAAFSNSENGGDFLSVGYVAGCGSKRNSAASFGSKQKRMSTVSGHSALEDIVISDSKEAKKETVRNSWWSATGVGGATQDPSVLEAQAIREEMRKSWWSGSNEVQEQLAAIESHSRRNSFIGSSSTGDKRKSVVSSTGGGELERRRINATAVAYQSTLVPSSSSDQELEYVDPRRKSAAGEKRKSLKPKRASGVPGSILKAPIQAPETCEEASVPTNEENEDSSALAFVVGK